MPLDTQRVYSVYVSDIAWNALGYPRVSVLKTWPLGPVSQVQTAARRQRTIKLTPNLAAHLEAIALISGLKAPYKDDATTGEGLIGLAIEAIGQQLGGIS